LRRGGGPFAPSYTNTKTSSWHCRRVNAGSSCGARTPELFVSIPTMSTRKLHWRRSSATFAVPPPLGHLENRDDTTPEFQPRTFRSRIRNEWRFAHAMAHERHGGPATASHAPRLAASAWSGSFRCRGVAEEGRRDRQAGVGPLGQRQDQGNRSQASSDAARLLEDRHGSELQPRPA